jgi:hypothetical protein
MVAIHGVHDVCGCAALTLRILHISALANLWISRE